MLLQAAVSISNTERWALEHGEAAPPAALTGFLRHSAFEVTVVDHFHRIARRHFERSGYRAVWERPFPTGQRGRPPAVDVALFDTANGAETRIELGLYSKTKLREDATKLAALGPMTAFPNVTNLIALWDVRSDRLTKQQATIWMKTFRDHAAAISTSAVTVAPLMASAVDLFSAAPTETRYVVVGLFNVT